jgi:hypothetical protein
MKPVHQRMGPQEGTAPLKIPASAGFLATRETVNLNSLVAAAVKQAVHTSGSIILRMDELPLFSAYTAQLQEAFHLLLRFMLAHQTSCGKVYCYVKGAPAGLSLLDGERDSGAYSISIHTNMQEGHSNAAQHLLQQAAELFAQNKIGLEYKSIPAGGMLFSLTLYGCAQLSENEPRQ